MLIMIIIHFFQGPSVPVNDKGTKGLPGPSGRDGSAGPRGYAGEKGRTGKSFTKS